MVLKKLHLRKWNLTSTLWGWTRLYNPVLKKKYGQEKIKTLHCRNMADPILAKGSRLACQWCLVDVRYPWGEESTQSLWCSFQKPITPVYFWKNISDKLILRNILQNPNQFYTKPLRSWETRTGWGILTDWKTYLYAMCYPGIDTGAEKGHWWKYNEIQKHPKLT